MVFLAIIIIAALCGLFSSGFLSSAHKENPASSLTVDYDRFARLMSETEVNVQVKNSDLAHTSVDFSPGLLSHYQIGDIRPQPDKMYSANGHLILVYNENTHGAPISLWLSITPKTFGKLSTTLQVNQQPAVTFNQFVFP
ncbi:hypothetical protein MXM31_04570 [Klebsiella aerogenes]|nr:hypothetical protein [Klebsiella aerogenes]